MGCLETEKAPVLINFPFETGVGKGDILVLSWSNAVVPKIKAIPVTTNPE